MSNEEKPKILTEEEVFGGENADLVQKLEEDYGTDSNRELIKTGDSTEIPSHVLEKLEQVRLDALKNKEEKRGE